MATTPDIAEEVISLCQQAAKASRNCAWRRGNVIHLTPEAGDEVMVVADLHGNWLNFQKLLETADLEHHPRRHLIMQEVCHGGPQYPGEGGCMSHLMLEDVAGLKVQYPDRFHFLLSNHELSELGEFPICKARKMLNLLFRNGISEMYGPAAERVRKSYLEFIAACPLAVRLSSGIFISHSCPERCDRDGFDIEVLHRPLGDADWRAGSDVFRLVWGRDFRSANAEAFARLVGAKLLVHGHEPCSAGFSTPNDRQVILDGCGCHACYVVLPIGPNLSQQEVVQRITRLHGNGHAGRETSSTFGTARHAAC
jgi:hypothetical protein